MDGLAIRLAQPRRRFDQRVEHGLQIERRATNHLEHVGRRGLLLQRFAQLVEQARILDGDDGLRGEIGQQGDLFVGERAYLLAVDDQRTNCIFVPEQGGKNHSAGTPKLDEVFGARVVRQKCRILHVIDMENLLGLEDAAYAS